MKRRLDFTDIFVAIGFMATMYGGYLLYLASYGGGTATARPSPPSMVAVPIHASLQTAMGQAIVERATLDHQFSHAILEGARKLSQATFALERRTGTGLKTIEDRAAQFQADYRSVMQYVLGTTIVNLTRQGIRQGLLTADTLDRSPFNARIIATTTSLQSAAESRFERTWQERLGQWIVDDATKERQFSQRMQERIGQATVALARTQHHYLTRRGEIDTQFHALAAAVQRVARQPSAVLPVARANMDMQPVLGGSFSHMRVQTWTEIPFAVFVLAFAGLVAVFFIALAMSNTRRESPDAAERIAEVIKEIYRKTG
ncbi:MAG: hypothetical protein D6690_13555 [Nitrospirae bacterium]|nr:MAG: hypothetical protein D6690_13555 [Nitrospirota bacterium]